ncbi:MAG: hypothetical protein ABIH23_05870 [bacterium]
MSNEPQVDPKYWIEMLDGRYRLCWRSHPEDPEDEHIDFVDCDWIVEIRSDEAFREQYETERARHLANLKRVEWCAVERWQKGSGDIIDFCTCPACSRREIDGHDEDCWLALEIQRLEAIR